MHIVVYIVNIYMFQDKVFEQLESFAGIPFTIQRIAELLTTPKRHYRRTDKFMRALEKNMLVVSHTGIPKNYHLSSSND